MAESAITFTIRVKPGAKSDHLGGTWGDDADGPLNVWVSKPAVDGAANKAVIGLLASALKLRKRQVTITAGHTSRLKTVRIDDAPADLPARLDRWRLVDRES